MRKQTKNLAMISFLVVVLMLGGVFAQSYLGSNKGYKPLPLPESKTPLPYNGDPTIVVTNTNIGIMPDPVYPVMPSGLRIYPDNQVTENGKAEYKVLFTDTHQKCKPTEEMACDVRYIEYKYKLVFASDEGVRGEFDLSEFSVGAGGSFSTGLTVKAKNMGTSSFVVSVLDENNNEVSYAKAMITYKKVTDPKPTDPYYFIGGGYIANSDGKGILVDFQIQDTKKFGLVGEAKIDGKSYYVKGSVVGASESNLGMRVDMIEFNVISMENGDVLGNFRGNLIYYSDFLVMKGTLSDFQSKSWELTAFGRDTSKIRESFPEPQPTGEVIIGFEDKTETTLITKAYN